MDGRTDATMAPTNFSRNINPGAKCTPNPVNPYSMDSKGETDRSSPMKFDAMATGTTESTR